ncbi:hypothetical protein IF2G_01423 [Cordyceps javanica]|nr:hypothetical protein IF2G_01423 [Cordyceps javanica]
MTDRHAQTRGSEYLQRAAHPFRTISGRPSPAIMPANQSTSQPANQPSRRRPNTSKVARCFCSCTTTGSSPLGYNRQPPLHITRNDE